MLVILVVVYNKQCKVCNHKNRLDIERLILQRMGYREILDEIDDVHGDVSLSRKNLSDHFTKHMIPARNEALEKLMSDSGTQAHNSINLLTELIDEWKDTYLKVLESTDYDDPRQKNALAMAQRLGLNLIKLNTDLMGEDGATGEFDLANLSKIRKRVSKQREELAEPTVNDFEEPIQTA